MAQFFDLLSEHVDDQRITRYHLYEDSYAVAQAYFGDPGPETTTAPPRQLPHRQRSALRSSRARNVQSAVRERDRRSDAD